MKQWKRLFFFLMLNILVSACTTLTVLVAWDQVRSPLPGGIIQPLMVYLAKPATPTPDSGATASPAAAVTPTAPVVTHVIAEGETFESIAQQYGVTVDELVVANGFTRSQPLSPNDMLRIPIKPVIIDNVIGVGDLATERVVLVNNLNGELSLAGWQLENNSGSSYTFPMVTLFTRGGDINLYSKSGVDGAADLFWGRQAPMWQSGMVVTLRDSQGKIQASYTIP
jgi:LysM repeat protein